MADQYEYLTSSGVIVPETSDLLATVEQEFRDAFGENLVTTANTPQGVLIAAEVTARTNVLRNNAAVANQINPALAGGVFLDALWRLTGGARLGATKSIITDAALTGVAGTLVPMGSVAVTANGDRFESMGDVTLGAGGTALVSFEAVEFGPVPAPPGSLTSIESAVLGWETVTNPTAAALGQDAESDASARRRRRDTLALQGVALPEAIVSGLYDTPGVRSLQFRENVTAAPATVDGINLAANSVWACVDGGTDADVAATLLARKSLGANWTGATVVNVTDATTGQVYAVKFDRPALVPILVRVTVRAVGVTGSPVDLTQAAILNYAAGKQEGERGFAVGVSVSPFELAGAVGREQPGLYVQKVEVTKAAVVNYQPAEVALALNELASLASGSSITVLTV